MHPGTAAEQKAAAGMSKGRCFLTAMAFLLRMKCRRILLQRREQGKRARVGRVGEKHKGPR